MSKQKYAPWTKSYMDYFTNNNMQHASGAFWTCLSEKQIVQKLSVSIQKVQPRTNEHELEHALLTNHNENK